MKPLAPLLPEHSTDPLLAALLPRNEVAQELARLDQEACLFALRLMAFAPASAEHEVALAELEALISARKGLFDEMALLEQAAERALRKAGVIEPSCHA
jgi:hypothetical protein